jgi:hypothetical protein
MMIKNLENEQNTLLLRPDQASKFLTAAGFPTARATLAKLRCVGSGPKFRRFGRFIVYSPSDLQDWAHEKISDPLSNTSQY